MAEYFADARPSPYMNKVYQATDACREKAPAVVHDDGSVRVQSVSAEDDDRLDATLAAFEARTGVPMLVNTSLNKRGQPICATLEDALACLFTSGLDALVVEDYLIEK